MARQIAYVALLAASAQGRVLQAASCSRIYAAPRARAPPLIMETVDMRRQRPAVDGPQNKYGIDPRARDGDGSGSTGPWKHTPGTVGDLDSCAQLSDAVAKAAAANRFVALKFRRNGCAACASTVEVYEATAKAFAAMGDFYLVDYDKARGFCKQCKLKFVPSGHIYSKGKLQAALPMGKKSWDEFAARVKECSDNLRK